MDEKLSRRDVLQKSAAFGILAAFGAGAAACKSEPAKLSCVDTTSLSSADAMVRTSLSYVDNSMEPGKNCQKCQQFLPGAPNACGGCKVLKGPINPSGYCKSFAAK